MIITTSDLLGKGIATNAIDLDDFLGLNTVDDLIWDRDESSGSDILISYYDVTGNEYFSSVAIEILDSGDYVITDMTFFNGDVIVLAMEETDGIEDDPDFEQLFSGSDQITGNKFKDTLFGYAGNDALNGLKGNDTLNGGTGRDSLTGGSSKDILTGGTGNDYFIFNRISESSTTSTSSDIITDFVPGSDKINLSSIDAFAPSSANDSFVWKGTSTFGSTTKGEVRYQKFDKSGTANDYTMVWIDNDRGTGVEMAIRLTGLHNLAVSDFIL